MQVQVLVYVLCTAVLNAYVKDVIVRDVIVIDGIVKHGIAGGGDFISLKLLAILIPSSSFSVSSSRVANGIFNFIFLKLHGIYSMKDTNIRYVTKICIFTSNFIPEFSNILGVNPNN